MRGPCCSLCTNVAAICVSFGETTSLSPEQACDEIRVASTSVIVIQQRGDVVFLLISGYPGVSISGYTLRTLAS
eukprot:scaffold3069_cov215-Amphora_coffeaeformis.AAC.29